MAINHPNAPPAVRATRMRVLNNGSEIPNPILFNVTQNNYFQADTFSVQFALPHEPLGSLYSLNWWSNQSQILLDIQASLDGGNSFQSLILGQVDRLTANPVTNVLEASGRDLTAFFIDAKTRETFQNQTSSQIATILAGRHTVNRHAMTPNIARTTTPVGRFYGTDHTRTTAGQFASTTTEWDLLCYLAQHEQYDVWVSGTTLNFQPQINLSTANPYEVVLDDGVGNFVSMVVERDLTLTPDAVVQLRSWNSREQKGFTVYSSSPAAEQKVASGQAQNYTYVIPNLQPAAAQALANKLREEITRHERLATIELPGDLLLAPRMPLRIRGTNSSWDQSYWVDSVTKRMSIRGGFTMSAKVKNHSPETQTLVG